MCEFIVPIRLVCGANSREHHMARARRIAYEHRIVTLAMDAHVRHALRGVPCTVTLTRIAPRALDVDDNLPSASKGPRDAIAKWLGVDDRTADVVKYVYAQRRGRPHEYALWVAISERGIGE